MKFLKDIMGKMKNAMKSSSSSAVSKKVKKSMNKSATSSSSSSSTSSSSSSSSSSAKMIVPTPEQLNDSIAHDYKMIYLSSAKVYKEATVINGKVSGEIEDKLRYNYCRGLGDI